MESYKGLHDLLRIFIAAEEQFSGWYEHAIANVTDPYCRARLEVLYEKHKTNIGILKAIDIDEYGAVEWLQFVPACESLGCVPKPAVTGGTPLEDIAETILSFDEPVAAIYDDMARRIVSENGRELFASLRQLKEQQILSIRQYLTDWK